MLRPLDGLYEPKDYPDLLVGLGEPDDAAVWNLGDGRALVGQGRRREGLAASVATRTSPRGIQWAAPGFPPSG